MEEIDYPVKFEIKIDFCEEKKKFYLSTPISLSTSRAVQNFVESRKGHTFKPHETSFHVDQHSVVRLIQELPFHWGHQPRFRQKMIDFWRLAKRCQQMLSEIIIEEKLKQASE